MFIPLSVPPHKLETDWAASCAEVILRRCPACERDSIIGHGRRRKQAHDEHHQLLIFAALHAKAAGDPDWDKGIRYFGSPEYERHWPGKPTRLVTAFVKAMPFGEERYTLTQGADANAR